MVLDNAFREIWRTTWVSTVVVDVDDETPVLLLPADPTRISAQIIHNGTLLWLCPDEEGAETTAVDGLCFPQSAGAVPHWVNSTEEIWVIAHTGESGVTVRALSTHRGVDAS